MAAISVLSVKAKPGCGNFCSDNTSGVMPEVLDSVVAAASGTAPSYGNDEWTKKLNGLFTEVCSSSYFGSCCG
jgi:threonine aldolase